ncbi:MAG: nitroreductase family protein, partial [Flavobacteriales bacterium]
MNATIAIKEARTERPVHPIIRQRFSPRAFAPDPLSEQDVLTLLEAARWAPSSMNEQPWRFHYAMRGSPAFDALRATLAPGNQPWTPGAAALVAISGLLRHQRNGAPNATWAFDTGMAVGNLLAQATSMGIYGHLLGGFDHEAATKLLGLDPERQGLICLLVLGRLGEADSLAEPFLSR